MKLRDLDSMDAMLDEHFSNDTGIKSGVKQMGRTVSEQKRKLIGDAMRSKSLEELVGEQRAAQGRQRRSESARGPRPPEVMQKIAATRRARNNYGQSMLGKEHRESTKAIMAVKAKIRQELRRQHNLGKSDTIPRELLEAEYRRRGI